ncbi:hypothetical protein DPMN_009289 [Dreissena polymorpha]|uniref:Uncharacterized protein n=1 Tax=Dreissena polymorpha TaxID=45954 RepID=A0A9D4N084_DREPO|nr:hypothetical protein DPMN_009289 [Dreissena polymorpha]
MTLLRKPTQPSLFSVVTSSQDHQTPNQKPNHIRPSHHRKCIISLVSTPSQPIQTARDGPTQSSSLRKERLLHYKQRVYHASRLELEHLTTQAQRIKITMLYKVQNNLVGIPLDHIFSPLEPPPGVTTSASDRSSVEVPATRAASFLPPSSCGTASHRSRYTLRYPSPSGRHWHHTPSRQDPCFFLNHVNRVTPFVFLKSALSAAYAQF